MYFLFVINIHVSHSYHGCIYNNLTSIINVSCNENWRSNNTVPAHCISPFPWIMKLLIKNKCEFRWYIPLQATEFSLITQFLHIRCTGWFLFITNLSHFITFLFHFELNHWYHTVHILKCDCWVQKCRELVEYKQGYIELHHIIIQ
jgi:hypothetical protein